MVLAESAGAESDARVASICPALVFERLWRETGCRDTIRSLPADRRHRFGKSKDGRGDRRQMVLGMVIDRDGVPVASHMWPGSTADVTTLDLVADAGTISKSQVAAVEARGWECILGARLRSTKEVRETVLRDSGPFVTVEAGRQRPDPMELQVKEVRVGGHREASHRYVVCQSPEQAAPHDRT